MVSTVTTATVSMVSSMTMVGSLTAVCILTLLALLVQKELTSSSNNRQAKILNRVLNVGIVPLIIAFGLITAVKMLEALW